MLLHSVFSLCFQCPKIFDVGFESPSLNLYVFDYFRIHIYLDLDAASWKMLSSLSDFSHFCLDNTWNIQFSRSASRTIQDLIWDCWKWLMAMCMSFVLCCGFCVHLCSSELPPGYLLNCTLCRLWLVRWSQPVWCEWLPCVQVIFWLYATCWC